MLRLKKKIHHQHWIISLYKYFRSNFEYFRNYIFTFVWKARGKTKHKSFEKGRKYKTWSDSQSFFRRRRRRLLRFANNLGTLIKLIEIWRGVQSVRRRERERDASSEFTKSQSSQTYTNRVYSRIDEIWNGMALGLVHVQRAELSW